MQYLPHKLTDHTKLLHKVAILHGDKVLLLQRSATAQSRPGCWDLPGGNSEWPAQVTSPTADLHQQDVAREIMEETSLSVDPKIFLPKKLIFFRTFFEPAAQMYSVICGWWLDTAEIMVELNTFEPSQVQLSSEHTAAAWVTLAEVETYDFGGTKGEFIIETITAAFHAKNLTASADYPRPERSHSY